MPNEKGIATDYRSTLNLPRTDFPMKADLAAREPLRVAWWREQRVYERRLERNAHNPPWILHDGPPYANNEVHVGTLLNRVLKDVFFKVHLLQGRYARFVPGWDMHGLPIEHGALKQLGIDFRKIDPIELRAKCREFALYWQGVQRDTFLRMGLLGEYDHPYMTIQKEFEATIVDTLAELAEVDQMYKGLRSTLWCINDETALADAEIEYQENDSPSIYVRFPASDERRRALLDRMNVDATVPGFADLPLAVLIWTTTPWTLPGNAAVAVKPDARYGMYRRGAELLIVAEALAGDVFALGSGEPGELLGTALGSDLVGAAVRHPLFDRDSEVVSADYVALDTGTGIVHTAPGHGADDFDTGVRFGLPTLVPVDASGHFTAEAGPYAGEAIFDANPRIVGDLQRAGALYFATTLVHSYPHCWRCKNPVIFRATWQWFIAMDVNRLRKNVVEKLPHVSWTPAWGEDRMRQMVENHPEWCVSRQRTWGTPIPSIRCLGCGQSILDADVARRVATRFREAGADVWWTDDLATFLPPDFACPTCQGTAFEKEFNIVDIWFESGVTSFVVLGKGGMPWPSDLVLEGADQFRGWFRSALLLGVAVRGHAPYRAVTTTGWVVDEAGHAMHKSTGNYVAAQAAMERWGADVLRLWCAAVEFTADIRFGDTLLQNVGSVYRNLRYRLRYLLGILDDFSLGDVIADGDLEPIDRLALKRFDDVSRRVAEHYAAYRLHDVYLTLVDFDADDLSRFYLDALKDRIYSSARDAARRRSGQTAALRLLRGLLAMLAPILSFTAEEAWQSVPERLRGDALSVFDLEMPHPHAPQAQDQAAGDLWETLKRLRSTVAASEGLRDFQLQAMVRVGPAQAERFAALGDNLREALIVSAVRVEVAPDVVEPEIVLAPADGEKCARCWKYLPLRSDPLHPTLCAPCAEIVRAFDATPAEVG
jgi:isoleucyl-tRNA synthetase